VDLQVILVVQELLDLLGLLDLVDLQVILVVQELVGLLDLLDY
jgi:hypothetical protein